ncbi:MAG: PilN domain-containing protein [Solirubrobacterales bacterium]
MKAINLLPPELRSRAPGDGDPRIAFGIVGGLAVVLLFVVASIFFSNKVTTLNDETAALNQQAEKHELAAAPVRNFNDFASAARSRTLLVGGLAATRFPWDRAMYNLSKSVPSDVTLESMKAVSVDAPTTDAEVTGTTVPTLELSGCTSGWIGYSRLTVWLKTMPGVQDVVSTQSSVEGLVSKPTDENTRRTYNCGPAPLKFVSKVFFVQRKSDLVGLPKVAAPAAGGGASGATGASSTTGAPAAATTGAQ